MVARQRFSWCSWDCQASGPCFETHFFFRMEISRSDIAGNPWASYYNRVSPSPGRGGSLASGLCPSSVWRHRRKSQTESPRHSLTSQCRPSQNFFRSPPCADTRLDFWFTPFGKGSWAPTSYAPTFSRPLSPDQTRFLFPPNGTTTSCLNFVFTK